MNPNSRIKWTRLKKILKIVTKKNVSINLTTELDDKYYAVVRDNMILINGNKCKSLTQIIKAISHEVVHIVAPHLEHGHEDFNSLWNDTTAMITQMYGDNNG